MKNNRIRKSLILGISLILVTSSIGAFSIAQGNTVDTVTSATTQEKTNTNSTSAPKSTPKAAPEVKTTSVPSKTTISKTTISKTVTRATASTARTMTILIDSKTDYRLIFNEQFILTSVENMDGTINQALEFYKGNTLEQVITTLKSKLIITEPYQFVIQSDDLTTLLDQYHKSEAYNLTHKAYDEHYDHENYEDHESHESHDSHDSHDTDYRNQGHDDHHEIDD